MLHRVNLSKHEQGIISFIIVMVLFLFFACVSIALAADVPPGITCADVVREVGDLPTKDALAEARRRYPGITGSQLSWGLWCIESARLRKRWSYKDFSDYASPRPPAPKGR